MKIVNMIKYWGAPYVSSFFIISYLFTFYFFSINFQVLTWNFHIKLTVIWLFFKIFKIFTLIFVFFQAVYEGQAYPMLMSVHLSIVSRMILSYKPEFQEFLNALATENGNHSDDIAAQILDVWMDKMPCVTQPERRKLLSLGTYIYILH